GCTTPCGWTPITPRPTGCCRASTTSWATPSSRPATAPSPSAWRARARRGTSGDDGANATRPGARPAAAAEAPADRPAGRRAVVPAGAERLGLVSAAGGEQRAGPLPPRGGARPPDEMPARLAGQRLGPPPGQPGGPAERRLRGGRAAAPRRAAPAGRRHR